MALAHAAEVFWLAEVVLRSKLPEDKFKKEQQIIIEEKGGHFGV
ncbi:MAG: hypothetical protein HW418_2054, partial [Anaerolineales bacterium]|nr:hypothetical protein [Anaerolineales bacterium]